MRTLPLQPHEATPIGTSCFSFAISHDRQIYFSNLEPFDSHAVGNRKAMMLRVAKLADESGVRRRDLEEAFQINRSTVQRAINQLREQGEASFYEPRRERGPSVLVGACKQEVERLLASGMKRSAVARHLGLSPSTLYDACRKGALVMPRPAASKPKESAARSAGPEAHDSEGQTGRGIDPADLPETVGETGSTDGRTGSMRSPSEPEEPIDLLDRSTRDQQDREAAMGRAAHDTTGRLAASIGAMSEVLPRFETSLSAVACGGVLTALPMLLREGLLKRTGTFLSLSKGYYGMTSVLLLLAFLFMARVRNPEALRYQAPGEWGALLGLDRCPEVKTLRRKIRDLGQDVRPVEAWQGALAADWAAVDPETCATLSVDGHVKVYTGRKARLAKHFVSRQKLCLPATTSYWVNALGGRPLLCLNKELDPGLGRTLEQDLLPALETIGLLGPEAPDLTTGQDAPPALTVVFDREGWSPALFKRLARRGIAVITWHKNFKGEAWPETDFRPVEVPVHGPASVRTTKVLLAEKRIQLKNGPRVRQIRRLLDNGRQVPLITTDFRMPLAQAAGALFSRWSQENFFKHMRQSFNLDALAVHGMAKLDPEVLVINPAWRACDKAIRRLRNRMGTLRNRIAKLLQGSPSPTARATANTLQGDLAALEAEREERQQERASLPKRVKTSELTPEQALDALPAGEKLLLDVIRMIAYRAETRMMPAVGLAQGKKQRPRRQLADLFQSAADIIPEPDKGVLRVRILGTASQAGDAAVAGLLKELNQTRTVFPGTDLQLVYELPQEPAKHGNTVA